VLQQFLVVRVYPRVYNKTRLVLEKKAKITQATEGKQKSMEHKIRSIITSWDKYSVDPVEIKVIKRGKTKGTQYVEVNKACLFEKTFNLSNSFGTHIAYRDLYFLKHLQPQKISPNVFNVTHDEKKQEICTYMECFPLDLDEFCREYSKSFYKKYLPNVAKEYRFRQIIPDYLLKRVFALVLKLDDAKIVHGDLKPCQFLYSPVSTDIRLTDYGFAGFLDSKELPPMLGWPVQSSSLGCQTFHHQFNESETITEQHIFSKLALLPYLNRWELDVAFWLFGIGVYDSLRKELKPYGRLSDALLPLSVQEQFQSYCKGEYEPFLKKRMQLVTPRSHYILSDCKDEIV